MPLYDYMFLAKPLVGRESLAELVGLVAQRAYKRNGLVTNIQSFGTIHLAYAIKKRDGRHYQGLLLQMTMMVPPSFNQELMYLNKEDRLLRWLVVKHRDAVYGLDFINEHAGDDEFSNFHSPYGKENYDGDKDEDEYDDDEEEDENEYQDETEE